MLIPDAQATTATTLSSKFGKVLSVVAVGLLAMMPEWVAPQQCFAGSLQVLTPTLDVASPGSTALLILRNSGSRPINARFRVFKWTQIDGRDQLTETQDLGASPKFNQIGPGLEQVRKFVRINKNDALGSEMSYRLLIEELPNVNTNFKGRFTGAYTVPVFFGPDHSTSPTLSIMAQIGQGEVRLTATNFGNKRTLLSNLQIISAKGDPIVRQDGPIGYTLGHSSISWTFPAADSRIPLESTSIIFETDAGPVSADLAISPLP